MRKVIGLLLEFGGLGLFGYGVWRFYHPAAYVLFGIGLVAGGLAMEHRKQ